MASVSITVLVDGTDYVEVAKLNANFSAIATQINGLLDNTNWTSAAGGKLDGTKLDLSTNSEFTTEHDSTTFTHTITSEGVKGLRITRNATYPASHIDVDADDIRLTARSGSTTVLTSGTTTGASGVDLTVAMSTEGALGIDNGADDGEETSLYYIYLVHDSSDTDTPDLTCVLSKQSTANTTFWANIDDHVMTGKAADYYAGPIGAVYNNADEDIVALPRPIAQGSFASRYSPVFAQAAVGRYAGDADDTRWIDVGFAPNFVMVKRDGASHPRWSTTSHDPGESSAFTNSGDIADRIKDLGWDATSGVFGFQVDNNAETNASGSYYNWFAVRVHDLDDPS